MVFVFAAKTVIIIYYAMIYNMSSFAGTLCALNSK